MSKSANEQEQSPYVHIDSIHDEGTCAELVNILHDRFSPTSVVDVGCGTGNFLKVFKDRGVAHLKGYDGSWVDPKQRRKFISDDEFETLDLNKLGESADQNIKGKYDLALCLEVAEHLEESAAEGLIRFLTSVSETVIFSAAIPNQPGTNHIHCRWPDYWGGLFRDQGY